MSSAISVSLTISLLFATTGGLRAQLALPISQPLPVEVGDSGTLWQDDSPGNTSLHGQLRSYWLSTYWLPNHSDGPVGVVKPAEVPQPYQYDALSFFCKWEVELEKAARIPVKFRLGSVDYVDWLEGKRRAYR